MFYWNFLLVGWYLNFSFLFKHVNLYTEGDTPEHCSFQIYFYSRAYIHAKFTKCKGSKLKSHFQFSITVNFKTRLSTKTFLRKTKEKERRKRKRVEEERRRREKSNGCTLRFHNGYFGRKTNCWTQKVHLAVTFSKIRLDIYTWKVVGPLQQVIQVVQNRHAGEKEVYWGKRKNSTKQLSPEGKVNSCGYIYQDAKRWGISLTRREIVVFVFTKSVG